jgi:pimeloyl-ACP methyl ester carboxylesterase
MTPAVLLACALAGAAFAAEPAAPPASVLPGDAVELKAVDGWTLKAVWRKADAGRPTVILLHGTGQRKEDWRPLARALDRQGTGFLAVDMRGHGESRTSPTGEAVSWKKLHATRDVNDYQDMTRDAEAGVGYLTGQGVAEDSIAVAGAEVGGSIAVKYAAVHPKVPFLIMLSPGLDWQEIPIVNAVRAFKGRPILLVYSEADKRSSKEAPVLYEFAKIAAGPDHAALIVVPEERGTRMLRADKGLIEQILAWIANPVPPAPAVSTTTAPGGAPAASTGAPAALEPAPLALPAASSDDDTFAAPAPAKSDGL